MKRTPHRILQLRDLIENLSRLDPEKRMGRGFQKSRSPQLAAFVGDCSLG